jgi:cobalt-zinc-cadmium resistance protein CzcA
VIESVVGFALRQRILVAVVSGLLVLGGLYTLRIMPIDAFPDVTNVQVQILTEVPGLSPVEVEKLVTFPIELVLAGLPGLQEVRSLSKFGLSQTHRRLPRRHGSLFREAARDGANDFREGRTPRWRAT